MKYLKTRNIYKASNVFFDCNTNQAFSYDWWCFFKVINGKNIFNNYKFSPTTGLHQYKVRNLLEKLNIKIDFILDCPSGLQSENWKSSAIKFYQDEIKKLNDAIKKPRSQEKKNKERMHQIDRLNSLIDQIKGV